MEEKIVANPADFGEFTNKGYYLLPAAILALRISPTAKLLYSVLLDYAWNKNCVPTQNDLIDVLGIVCKKTLRKHLLELRTAGVLTIEKIREGGKQNTYTLLCKPTPRRSILGASIHTEHPKTAYKTSTPHEKKQKEFEPEWLTGDDKEDEEIINRELKRDGVDVGLNPKP